MKRALRLSMGIMFAIALSAQAKSTGWGDLSSWKDSYPVRDEGRHRQALLREAAISDALGRLLSPSDVQKLSSYTVASKNEVVDGFLIVAQCKPHDCGSENAVVVLEQNSDNIWVRLNEVTDRAISTRWYGNHSSYMMLPDAIRAKVAAKYDAS